MNQVDNIHDVTITTNSDRTTTVLMLTTFIDQQEFKLLDRLQGSSSRRNAYRKYMRAFTIDLLITYPKILLNNITRCTCVNEAFRKQCGDVSKQQQ